MSFRSLVESRIRELELLRDGVVWSEGLDARVDELRSLLTRLDEDRERVLLARREEHACDVCWNIPDAEGVLEHGRGCYVVSSDGGGETYHDVERGPEEE